ncbi:MAG: succinate dehydrogenase iron-sulfur subunit [Spirochaetaceae bacterium]|nr:MAG: succinate dehydrogenase iron-sulfur subunit [Spirochaetaceae bacterium]
MKVTLRILRNNDSTSHESVYKDYPVEVEPTDRILDALQYITWNVDGTLGYRRSCAHGVCGSDAMRINGRERLACKVLFQDVVDEKRWVREPGKKATQVDEENTGDDIVIAIEPLMHLPVQRDLMVNQTKFFENFRAVKPWIVPKEEPGEKEYVQSEEEHVLFDEATKCINCAACYSACPILDENPDFIGPSALVHAARFVRDSRDKGLSERLEALDQPNGLWACTNQFECTKVCPRDIKITKLINLTKRELTKYRASRGESVNDGK